MSNIARSSLPEDSTLERALAQFLGPAAGPAAQPISASVLSGFSEKAAQGLAENGFGRLRRFCVLPSAKAPRWLLPLDNRRGMLGGLSICATYAPTARLMRTIAVGLIKAGWNGWGLPPLAISSRGPLAVELLVREITGEPDPSFALLLAPCGRFRKLTAQVMRPNGEILGYIKVPLTEAATERVHHEVSVLKRLSDSTPLCSHIPRVLYAGELGDAYILFQTPGPSCPGPLKFRTPHEAFLRTLWSVRQLQRPGRALVDEVAARWREVAPHIDVELCNLADRAFETAHHELDTATVPCGIMHGDFTPWNTRLNNGRLFVFDWESAAWDAPLLWDAFHFDVQSASLLNWNGQRCFVRGSSPKDKACFLLYLLNSLSAYVEEEGADPRGIIYRKRLLSRELQQGQR